jgi:hypothetical protein
VLELAVPEVASRAVATVPVDRLEALSAVRFAPLTAGRVAGKRASGTVPEARLDAFRLVRLEPLPPEGVPIFPPEIYKVPV